MDLAETQPHVRSRIIGACQECRLKKTKCTGEIPCAPCLAAGIICQPGAQRKKRAPNVKDVYIRELESRVAELEGYLNANGPSPASDNTFSSEREDSEDRKKDVQSGEQNVDSATSAMLKMSLADGSLYPVAGQSSYRYFGSSSALAMIRETAGPGEDDGNNLLSSYFIDDEEVQDGAGQIQAQLPGREVSMLYIDKYFERLNSRYPILDEDQFRAQCEPIFGDSDDLGENVLSPLASQPFLVTYLMVLCWGEYFSSDDTGVDSVTSTAGWRFFMAAFSDIREKLRKARLETMQGNMLIVLYLQAISKSSLAYFLLGILVRLMQTAGMHRRQSMAAHDGQARMRLINIAYALDTQLALVLGRPCAIHDFDCDFLSPPIDKENSTPPSLSLLAQTELASLSGRIHRELYTPGIVRLPQDQLLRVVADIDTKLNTWRATYLPDFESDLSEVTTLNFDFSKPRQRENVKHTFAPYITYLHLKTTLHRTVVRNENAPRDRTAVDAAKLIINIFTHPKMVVDPASWLLVYHLFSAAAVLHQWLIESRTSGHSPNAQTVASMSPEVEAFDNDLLTLQRAAEILTNKCRGYCGAAKHVSKLINGWVQLLSLPRSSLVDFDNTVAVTATMLDPSRVNTYTYSNGTNGGIFGSLNSQQSTHYTQMLQDTEILAKPDVVSETWYSVPAAQSNPSSEPATHLSQPVGLSPFPGQTDALPSNAIPFEMAGMDFSLAIEDFLMPEWLGGSSTYYQHGE